MAEKLTGKVALVTGASAGMGAALVHRLLGEGVRVAAVARRGDRLREIAAEAGAGEDRLLLIEADVNDAGAVEKFVADATKWGGRLDILINNAGLSRGAVLEQSKTDDLRIMLETNVFAMANVSRLAIPALKRDGGGDIVNIGSIAARATMPGSTMYSATKAAVGAFSEALRRELLNDAVRVTVVHPGYVKTEFFDNITDPEKRARTDAAMAAMDPVEAEDIADLILYVLTRPARVNLGDVTIRPTKQPV